MNDPLRPGPVEPAPVLTVVIPFLNEAESIAPLLAELRDTLNALQVAAEVIAVNDGSTDATGPALDAVARTWPALHVMHFPQNRGQAAALWHGFRQARGTWLAMLDGDGQNPPAEFAKLWPLRDTADMIAGARTGRQDSKLRLTMSRVANAVRRAALAMASATPVVLSNSSAAKSLPHSCRSGRCIPFCRPSPSPPATPSARSPSATATAAPESRSTVLASWPSFRSSISCPCAGFCGAPSGKKQPPPDVNSHFIACPCYLIPLASMISFKRLR